MSQRFTKRQTCGPWNRDASGPPAVNVVSWGTGVVEDEVVRRTTTKTCGPSWLARMGLHGTDNTFHVAKR